ncbi:MAG: SIR2 family protein [Ignavibacteria bacterium]|nr:SIR2 family protein [Ignavibacteria bacterium]
MFKEVHELLLDIKAYAYITTNIDKGMEMVKTKFERNQKIYDLTKKIPSKISSLINNGNIFYLHGSCDNISTSIFNNENYFSFYDTPEIKKSFTRCFSGRFTVLFIGYGLGDYEILTNIFLAAKKNNYLKSISHYSLMPIFSNDLNRITIEERYLEIFSVCPLFYYIDYSNYKIILEVLKKFKELVNDIKSPKSEIITLIDSA